MTLTDTQWDLINYCEQEYLAHGALPSADRVEQLGVAGKLYYQNFLQNEVVRKSLLARGVPLALLGGPGGPSGRAGVLTEEQLTAANVMLDLQDNRSQKKKLADLRVSSQKWQAWLRDPTFQDYLRKRAENLLGDNYHEANLALLDRIRSGDTSAIKFYYEITGRYNPNRGDSVDLASLLMRIMEIIQKHVTDNEVAAAIADEFITLASGVGVGLNQRSALPVSDSGVIDL